MAILHDKFTLAVQYTSCASHSHFTADGVLLFTVAVLVKIMLIMLLLVTKLVLQCTFTVYSIAIIGVQWQLALL